MKSIALPEIVSLGLYNAQLAWKNRTVTKNRKTTMFELELPMEDGGISFIDKESRPITRNLLICAKPGQIRHTQLPFKCYYIHMIVNEGRLFEILSSFPTYTELADAQELRRLFVSICDKGSADSYQDEILLQSLILRLVYTLDRYAPHVKVKHVPKHSNSDAIKQTLKYISDNLASDLSLKVLAERSRFSPVYFHKMFKASTGKNVREYVEEQRIKRAIELLITTELTLTQIAYECGFSSQSYFSYAFKRKMSLTPREYAKELQLKYEKKM